MVKWVAMRKQGLKSINIDPTLHQQVKIRAAEEIKTITELVEAALVLYLDDRGGAPSNPKDEGELT